MPSALHNFKESTPAQTSARTPTLLEADYSVLERRRELTQTSGSHTNLLFAPLSPYEKGYFTGVEGGRINQQVMRQVYALIARGDQAEALTDICAMNNMPAAGKKDCRELLRSLPANLPESRIQYFQHREYDYFEELKKQYKFYITGESFGAYTLNSQADTAEHRLALKKSGPSVAFIVDGIHSLGVGNPEDEFLHAGQKPQDVSMGRLKSRIRQLKGEETLEDLELKTWSHPPFLFRLASRFGNGLFGHARSFPQAAQIVLDQRRYLDKGVIKGSGYEIVAELLGLDEALRPTGSKRILIDMLHLSASARNDLYEKIFRTHNKNVDPSHPIPVVFTNAAYSGVDYLAEMIKNSRDGVERDDFRVNGFYGGSINLTDEDVLAVFRSNGMIGITLEERRMGHEPKGFGKLFSGSPRARALRLLSRQVAGMVSVPFAYHAEEPLNIWNCLAIGHGLSGEGTLFGPYTSTLNAQVLAEDLEEVFTKLKKLEPFWFGAHQPAALARKVCYENVMVFVAQNG